ncbi:hypothetical protein IFM89_025241 [Coptis chinensis]|uniref:DUF4283 domain-containing protein n=1 Tax=Coptis chinensis TaxID=261450 RepID=A0A835LBP7_9MAGN|nr:hypothetical protein IFM89_025241 [Coptis chinensis]
MGTQLDNLQNFPMLQVTNGAIHSSREQGNNPSMVNNRAQNTQQNPPANSDTRWSSLFQGDKVSPPDTALQRFDLDMIEGVTQVPFDLRWKGLNVWRDYVVGFFLEQRLPYLVVREALKKKWKTKGDYEMVADAELFYFKFSNEEDKRKVLENSPIYIVGKCFIATQWTQDIEKRKNTVKAIPIWANLGQSDAVVINRRAETAYAEGVDNTIGNPNEVSMDELCLNVIAIGSEGVLRSTDESSVVTENAEGLVATDETTQLVEGSAVVVNATNMILDRSEGSEMAVVITTP